MREITQLPEFHETEKTIAFFSNTVSRVWGSIMVTCVTHSIYLFSLSINAISVNLLITSCSMFTLSTMSVLSMLIHPFYTSRSYQGPTVHPSGLKTLRQCRNDIQVHIGDPSRYHWVIWWVLPPDITAVLYIVQSMIYLAHGHSSISSVGACTVLKTFHSIITFIILCFPFIFLCYFSYFFVSLSYFFVTFHNSLSPLHISLLPFMILCLPCIFLCVSFIFLWFLN